MQPTPDTSPKRVFRRPTDLVLIVILALTQTALCAALVLDDVPGGRVVLAVSPTHGVHVADLPIIAVWLLGLGVCLALLRIDEK